MRKERMSNIELLRITAMILVMLGHSHLRMRTFDQDNVILSFFEVMSNCVSTMGVGIFIAISGWFGIRFNIRGLLHYLFQIQFILWTLFVISVALRITEFNTSGIRICMGLYNGYWFIIGYLGLYLISPVLNNFIEKASKSEFLIVLISIAVFQCIYSWLTAWFDYYNGYSLILFSFIYLCSAFFRKYPIAWIEKQAFALFVATVLIMTSVATISWWNFGHAARQIRDDNPLVIIACILLLLSFKKIKFQSKMVNWVAASCFSVYLIHYSPYIYPQFLLIIKNMYIQYSGLTYCFMLILFLSVTYLACTAIDQFRILAWRGIDRLLQKKDF